METSQKPVAERGLDSARIAQDLQIRRVQVDNVIQLLDDGNTVPFITRYRKERTGGLDEEFIRLIQQRVHFHRQLSERKQIILKTIEGQGKLTDELRDAILAAETTQRLEDLYVPYKPKKKTLAGTARERGLEPFALAIWGRDPAVANLAETAAALVNPEKELPAAEDVLLGAKHILAELIAETADVRAAVRSVLWETGKLVSAKDEKVGSDKGLEFRDYFQFSEGVRRIPPHRVQAINRGERQNILKVQFEFDSAAARRAAAAQLPLADHPHAEFLGQALDDALGRLLLPSLEREIRRELSDEAAEHAIRLFARNLRGLLLQRPIRPNRLLAVDPGFRTGCKLAALDETGNLLEHVTIYPHPPQKKRAEARLKLEELIRKHQTPVIVLGNGTGCRETEEFVSDFLSNLGKPRASEPPAAEPSSTPPPETGLPAPEVVASPPLPEGPAPPTTDATTTPVSDQALAEAAAAPNSVDLPEPASPPGETPEPKAEGEAPGSAATPPAAPPSPPPLPAIDLSALPPPPADLAYVIVNEAGASVYSASAVGKEEFPHFDATVRGTVSLGRRLQDPLAELVKVEPQHVGVGQYQHDMSPKWLREALEAVVESCVNHVGVDVNTASVPLLRHVAGLNQHVARELVEYRAKHGPFKSREQLLQVPSVGPARYTQAAGFLKIHEPENPLDQTGVHPESYPAALGLLAECGCGVDALRDRAKVEELCAKFKTLPAEEVAARLKVGVPTLRDITEALARPGRDPREELPEPVFKKGVLKLEDLHAGMELKGTVLNVVDFGAFVDVGLKDSGLIHISQLANRFIKTPHEVVTVGDVVTVWVLNVDGERRRVSLSMIPPGTVRKPPERKPAPPPRPPREADGQGPPRDRPPQGRRPQGGGRRDGRPPHHGSAPRGRRTPAEAVAAAQTAEGTSAAAQTARPAPRPRRPERQPPKPKLSKDALEGTAPLRTFSELKAFFEAQRDQGEPKPGPGAAAGGEAPPPPPQ